MNGTATACSDRIADFQPAPLPKWHVSDVAQRALRTLAKAKHPEAFGLFSTLMAACCGKCRCWPSTSALMDWTELPRRTIERHRAVLIAAGLVTTHQPGGRRLIYTLPGLAEAGYPIKATAASAPAPKVTRQAGSNVLEVDFDQEPAPAPQAATVDPDPVAQRRADYEKLRREAVPAPPPQAATVATDGDPGSPPTATLPKGTKRSSADETPLGFHSAERERESAPATADAAGADSHAPGSDGTEPEPEDGNGGGLVGNGWGHRDEHCRLDHGRRTHNRGDTCDPVEGRRCAAVRDTDR